MTDVLVLDSKKQELGKRIKNIFSGSWIRVSSVTEGDSVIDKIYQDIPILIIVDGEIENPTWKDFLIKLKEDDEISLIPAWLFLKTSCEQQRSQAYRIGYRDISSPQDGDNLIKSKIEAFFEKQKTETSVNISLDRATKKFKSFLPQQLEVPGLSLGCIYRPYEKVGGDFYDVIQLSNGEYIIYVADVTGHGVEAAFIQTMAKKLFSVRIKESLNIKQALITLNNDLKQDLFNIGMFVAVSLVHWNPYNQKAYYYHLGCPHPIIRKSDGTGRTFLSNGTILGMHSESSFTKIVDKKEISLETQDLLLLHTDGVIEAPLKEDGNVYGLNNLRRDIQVVTGESPQEKLNYLMDLFEKEIYKIDDDITLLALEML